MMQQCALIGRHNPSPSPPPGALPQSMLVMLTQCRPKASPDAIRGLGLYPTQIAPPFLLSRHLFMQCATSHCPRSARPPSPSHGCHIPALRISVLQFFSLFSPLSPGLVHIQRHPAFLSRSRAIKSAQITKPIVSERRQRKFPGKIVGNRCLGETGAAKATHCLQPS